MSQTDHSTTTLHTAVNCYLSTLQTVADSLAKACPAIGGPYRQRLSRLRTRLAFDANVSAIEESCAVVEAEIQEYARKSSAYVERHGTELNRTVTELHVALQSLTERQQFYTSRLKQFASDMGSMELPSDPAELADIVALQLAGLLSCVDSMSRESQASLERMNEAIDQARRRMEEAEITDPVTGLMNRREMTRRIEERRKSGEAPTLMLFTVSTSLADEAAQQIAARLGSQFRYSDLLCRWSAREFLVLFQGGPETARIRVEQILPWIAGRYLLDNGTTLEITAEAKLVDPEWIGTPELVEK